MVDFGKFFGCEFLDFIGDVSGGGGATEFLQGMFGVDALRVGVVPTEEVVDGAVEQEAKFFEVEVVDVCDFVAVEVVRGIVGESIFGEEMDRACDSFAIENFGET